PLPADAKIPAFRHIDRFKKAKNQKAAARGTNIECEAHGTWWPTSVATESKDHHGGEHTSPPAWERSLAALRLNSRRPAIKLSVFCGGNLDGFLARLNDALDLLHMVDRA